MSAVHTATNSNGTLTITAQRMDGVTVKTRMNKFTNVNVIYYTVTNNMNDESATYVHIETMPNTLTRNMLSFIHERLDGYARINQWYISRNDVVDYIYYN
jgi:hypothetical protein